MARSAFRHALSSHFGPSARSSSRRWVYVPYDQLSDQIGPLSRRRPQEIGIVLVETSWKPRQRPYHKQKLALLLANQRHFALEQAARGVAVRYLVTDVPYAAALRAEATKLGKLACMRPAEYELRNDLKSLFEEGLLEEQRHEGWLSTSDDFEAARTASGWRMDAFYRHVRRRTGLLMQAGKPVGGKFSFDAENRKPWKGSPPPPEPRRFSPDETTLEVKDLVEHRFADHPGEVDLGQLPATAEDAASLWHWALTSCLESFGPYEDAMTVTSQGLFHTRISALLNIHRLLPERVIADVALSDAPLASREGFVRQVLGWREFVRHVHDATEGLRTLPGGGSEPKAEPTSGRPGDGGWYAWAGKRRPSSNHHAEGGSRVSELGAANPLPPAFWGAASGLACLDHVVAEVLSSGYSHHITRLMILGNIATLLDVLPRELTDWFWVAYTDAYDWVVEPNVLGMATFAAGELMTTKPYVSGAAYIHRMSDYCSTCRFDPKSDCPLTALYWAFLARHEKHFSDNHRMRLPLASLKKRSPTQRIRDARIFEQCSESLARGDTLRPEHFDSA